MSMSTQLRATPPAVVSAVSPRAPRPVLARHVPGVLLLLAASATTGCQRHIFSPPARSVPLDAPRVLAPGETAVNLTGSHTDSIFDANVNGGTLGVRRGLTERVEVQAEASGYHVDADEETRASISRTAIAGRVGTKVGLLGRHVSALAGVGGGHHAAGGFITPDVGLTVGFDNPYFVPFLLGRVGVSQPIGAKTLDLSRPSENPGTALSRPQTSTYYGFTLGGRVPIEPRDAKIKGGILGGLAFQEIRDQEESKSGLGLTLGGEIIF